MCVIHSNTASEAKLSNNFDKDSVLIITEMCLGKIKWLPCAQILF